MAMPFRRGKNFYHSSHTQDKKTECKKTFSLRVHFPQRIHLCTVLKRKTSQLFKRVSPYLLKGKRLTASASVEAALAVPLFLFFLVNLMILINVFGKYSYQISIMQQSAREIALISNDIDSCADEMVISETIVPINPVVNVIAFNKSATVAVMKYRKWNGYDLKGSSDTDKEEEYVYITENGSVYHRNRGCSHLNVSVRVVAAEDIGNDRNNNGEKYKPCEICGGNGSGLVFVTPEGDRYHSKSDCSGLKRVIKIVKLSEVEGRAACSECGW